MPAEGDALKFLPCPRALRKTIFLDRRIDWVMFLAKKIIITITIVIIFNINIIVTLWPAEWGLVLTSEDPKQFT